jgi:hypothetical protein
MKNVQDLMMFGLHYGCDFNRRNVITGTAATLFVQGGLGTRARYRPLLQAKRP